MKYAIVTPVFNEEKTIGVTIESVLLQHVSPLEWLIYNDRSADNTETIIRGYAKKHTWIRLINGEDIAIQDKGARIAYIVNHCVKILESPAEYIVKLDADISFNADFFCRIFMEFESDPRLGIASGRIMHDGKPEPIRHGREHTRGATKVYRKTCWNQIGGLYLTTGWDSLDDFCAMYYGWKTQTLDYYCKHLKKEGGHLNFFSIHFQDGLFAGRVPYRFSYLLARLFLHLFDQPPVLSSIIKLYGYLYMRCILKEKLLPTEISKFCRKKQKERIMSLVFRSVAR